MSARKPTALKVLEGTERADRANPDEPTPELFVKPPKAPEELDKVGRAKWRQLVPRLIRQRLLTEADLEMLRMTCAAYATWLAASGVLTRDGFTYEAATESGAVMHRKRPEVEIERDAWRRYVVGLREFGQSPSSRTKVSSAREDYVDPAEEFLGGRRRTG